MPLALPTGRAGQALAATLPVLLATAILAGGVMPLAGWWQDRADELARQATVLHHMEALVETLPALRQAAVQAAAGSTGGASLLQGATDSVAGALLQERLQAGLAQSGLMLNSVETLPGEDAGRYRRIRLRLAATGSWPALVAWLRDLQGAAPVMFVEELQIQPALHKISTAPGSFDVSCVLLAFRPADTTVAAR